MIDPRATPAAPDAGRQPGLGDRLPGPLGARWRAFIDSRDDYGPALLLIIATIGARAIVGAEPIGIFVGVVFGGLTLVFVLNTSGAPRRLVRSAGALAVTAMLVSAAALIAGAANPQLETLARELSALMGLILAVVAPIVIFRRLATRPEITFPMVLAALCVYLLFGLAYSYVFSLISAAEGVPFFVQAGEDGPTNYIYFSYVTMTTVGYGDLTAASDLGRIVAVSEALLGQMYLVSVVALLVGNLGRQRAPVGRSDEKP